MTPTHIRRFGTFAIAASTLFLMACPKKGGAADAAADADTTTADTASADTSASAAPTATHAWVPTKKNRGGACKHDADCAKPWACVSHDKVTTCEKTGACTAPEVQKTGNTMTADGGAGPSVNWCLGPADAGAAPSGSVMPSAIPVPSASAPPVGPSALPVGPTAPPSTPCKTNADCTGGKTCQPTAKPGLSVCK
jgi:hypothetical protein